MIRSKENNIDKRPFALFNSLPFIPSIRSYYGKTKHSNFLIERGCNIAEATVRPVYQLSEPTLQRLDEYANDKVRRSRLLVHNAYKSAVKTAVWPASYLYGYASHGLDLVADTPVGHIVEGAYDAADEVIDNILPAAEMEGELEDDENMSSLDKKSPVRRVYRRINSQSLTMLPSRTISYSKKLSHSMSDRALSHALDISAFLVNRSYFISANVASTIISATPGSKFVAEKIGSRLVPSEKLAKNLKVVLSGVLDQLKVWHRRANKAHMRQTVELIDTITILMKSLQDKVSTSEETRQGAQNSKEQKSRAPIHPSVSQLNESRYLSNKHRLEDNEAPARDKKAKTVEGQSLNDAHPRNKEADGWQYAHYDRQRHVDADSHEEVHDYDSDDATENNPFGLLSALSKKEESHETEDREQPSHVLTYAEVVQHPAETEATDSEPNEAESSAEKPAPTHNKTSYATIVQRPPVVYVDPIVAAHQKEADSHNWHQVDHAHAAHGIKELEAPLKPVEVDNPFLGLNVESPHIPEAKHKQHKHHTAKSQPVQEDNIEADLELDEGWQVVPSKRHHDVYMSHERLPQEWKDAIQNPFDALTNEESKEAQMYKCILDEYLDMVDAVTPHDAVRHDKLTHILKRKAALMSNARRTTAKRQAQEIAKEQQFEESRMDGEGAAMSHALPAGFAVVEPEELEASRMDAEGGAVSHAIPAVPRTESAQQIELEKTRMDAEGAAVSSAVPVHVHTDVFVDSHHSFADVVKSGDVHAKEETKPTPTPHAWAHVDSTHTFADVVKAGVASV